jgi:1,2-dihydroxy-3-keto-5-methylthiopentene dioxygenase
MIEMPADDQWPEAWLLDAKNEQDGGGILLSARAENRCEPNVAVRATELRKLGICFWKLPDTDLYNYPSVCVPWDPVESNDPLLRAIRQDHGYSYADILTIHPNFMTDFDAKLAMFYQEHIHDAEEIRYVLSGSVYFDVRSMTDTWIRVRLAKGDLMILPEGLYHRATLGMEGRCHLMRLFKGLPEWTSYPRPQEEHPSRKLYVSRYNTTSTT